MWWCGLNSKVIPYRWYNNCTRGDAYNSHIINNRVLYRLYQCVLEVFGEREKILLK